MDAKLKLLGNNFEHIQFAMFQLPPHKRTLLYGNNFKQFTELPYMSFFFGTSCNITQLEKTLDQLFLKLTNFYFETAFSIHFKPIQFASQLEWQRNTYPVDWTTQKFTAYWTPPNKYVYFAGSNPNIPSFQKWKFFP